MERMGTSRMKKWEKILWVRNWQEENETHTDIYTRSVAHQSTEICIKCEQKWKIE